MHAPMSQDHPGIEAVRRPHPRRVRVAESVYQRISRETGRPVPSKYEFTYRDANGRQVWQTANGTTKADAKAERAELLARMHKGERVERTTLTVSEVAQLWLERASGPQGKWARPTRERYERIVRLHIDASADPAVRPIGDCKLRQLTMDRVAAWSQANERVLAPTTARIVLIALNQICRFAVRRGWLADNPVAKLEPGEKPRWRPKHVAILEGEQLARLPRSRRHRSGAVRVPRLHRTADRRSARPHLGRHRLRHGLIRVHRQLTRHREHGPLKTAGRQDEKSCSLPRSPNCCASAGSPRRSRRRNDLVFANTHRPQASTTATSANDFRATIKRAGITARRARLSLHSLRHGFASLLIAQRPERRLRLPPARPRQPEHHARAPTRTSTPAQTTPPPPEPHSKPATPLSAHAVTATANASRW